MKESIKRTYSETHEITTSLKSKARYQAQKPAILARAKSLYLQNPEPYKERALQYYRDNRDRINAARKTARAKSPAKFRAASRKYYRKNKARILALAKLRYQAKISPTKI